jgi:hypothetical protein
MRLGAGRARLRLRVGRSCHAAQRHTQVFGREVTPPQSFQGATSAPARQIAPRLRNAPKLAPTVAFKPDVRSRPGDRSIAKHRRGSPDASPGRKPWLDTMM